MLASAPWNPAGQPGYLLPFGPGTTEDVTDAPTVPSRASRPRMPHKRVVADGKNPNDVRIYQLMTARPTVVNTITSLRDAAEVMTSGRFRHLPVMGDAGLVGIVDITDVCRALLEADVSRPPADTVPPE